MKIPARKTWHAEYTRLTISNRYGSMSRLDGVVKVRGEGVSEVRTAWPPNFPSPVPVRLANDSLRDPTMVHTPAGSRMTTVGKWFPHIYLATINLQHCLP
jgi:hypothetical protein